MLRHSARRFMATASSKSVTPPLQLYTLDGTYATALYTAAAKSNSLSKISSDLSSLKSIVNDSKVVSILSNPSLPSGDRKKIVDELAKDKSGETVNFLNLVAENNRLGLLPEILSSFDQLIQAHEGIIDVTVTSAQPLSSKETSRLQAAIEKSSFAKGKKLKVTNKVSEGIIGGLVVDFGDRVIDLSVSHKIARLNKLLTDAI